jgi:cytochrome b561
VINSISKLYFSILTLNIYPRNRGESKLKYNRAQVSLHWIIFLLVIAQYAFHEAIVNAFEAMLEGKPPLNSPLVSMHLGIGGIIGILTAVRFWIRIDTGVPEKPGGYPKIFHMIASVVHLSFYGILILLPLTGGFAWYQSSEAAADAHSLLRAVLILFILLHLIAVLIHTLIFKNKLIRRMWLN